MIVFNNDNDEFLLSIGNIKSPDSDRVIQESCETYPFSCSNFLLLQKITFVTRGSSNLYGSSR